MRTPWLFAAVVAGIVALGGCQPRGQVEPAGGNTPAAGVTEPKATPTATGVNDPQGTHATTNSATQPARQYTFDVDKAINVELPAIRQDLQPVTFKVEGDAQSPKGGWVLRIPGNRPIATPAYADGLLFVGGGYGSHEFYAFDAVTGKLKWQMKCADDGPTAAVVEDGYVAFNTESCTVVVCEAKTGKVVWQEWLGDPLMSQPAIANGKLFIAYPGGNPRGVQKVGNGKPEKSAAVGPAKAKGHRLLCADLKTGRHLWEQDITADVISAPIIDGHSVVFTCGNGTTFSLSDQDGAIAWQKDHGGTSAPVLANGQVVLTERQTAKSGEVSEGIRRLDAGKGTAKEDQPLAMGKAEYFRPGKEGSTGLSAASQAAQDQSVGFGSGGIVSGAQASNLNTTSVAGNWAYQGSKAAYANGQILNSQGTTFNSVNAETGQVRWQVKALGKGVDENVQSFVPPALGKENLYVCSTRGHFLALNQETGQTRFLYHLHAPVAFQACLAKGNMYVGTSDGRIICLETGNQDADGWYAWGGNAQHNKKY